MDRFITLYLFYNTYARRRANSGTHIPILMYHSISDKNSHQGIHPYYQTNTSPTIFNVHMEYLRKNNYMVLSPAEAMSRLSNASQDKIKYVVITFDDGFRDVYLNAWPILEYHGFNATVYLPTAFIGKNGKRFKDAECLNWNEIIELNRKGIFFGSHTVNHPQLYSLNQNEIEYELRYSKETIESNLGCAIDSFSYPYAYPVDNQFINKLRGILYKCGYKNAVSTRIGTTSMKDDNFAMKRIPVNSSDDLALFRAKLEGGYDWLYYIQYVLKKMKKRKQ